MTVTLMANGLVRIAWPIRFVGYTLQYAVGLDGIWANAALAVTVEGNEFVAYDLPGNESRFYRLIRKIAVGHRA